MANNAANGSYQSGYEQLPYPSLPIAYSQPASLAAMGHIFGASPADATTASVLELGCASGGNIIPLAQRFPRARFVGIDLSARHVSDATTRIASLGLKNIAIRQADLTRAKFDKDAFDYILCHGVFSWVPREAQDAIFRICGESLKPNGIAAVSFNVLPGWHMRRVVRDILLFHADPKAAPAERVARARQALAEIAAGLPGSGPYPSLLRAESERLAKAPSAYILGEFLVDHNAPCYFSEFAARAGQAGLSYLCEGELVTTLPDHFSPSVAARVRKMAGDNPIAVQQYTDFFTGRPFRRALLMRSANAPKPAMSVDPLRLKGLHFAANLQPKVEPGKAGELVFVDTKGRPIRAKAPVAAAMLKRLAAAYPATQTLDELIGRNAPEGTEAKALSALMALVINEQATLSSLPLTVGRGDGEKPRAWAVARLDATAGQPWATALHHVPVRLSPVVKQLLPHLTGSNDRAALKQIVGDGEVLEKALAYAARHGLLDQ